VLFLYYTYTQQGLKVVEAMAKVMRDRGIDVHQADIEFTDPRYAKRFNEFPMPHPMIELVGMLPVELRRATGEIRIPEEARGSGTVRLRYAAVGGVQHAVKGPGGRPSGWVNGGRKFRRCLSPIPSMR
jgi:hypothetical protein